MHPGSWAIRAFDYSFFAKICVPAASGVRSLFGLSRIYPSDEVNAWRWVLEHTPVWLPAMHQRMTECLASYRPDATPEEARAIDQLCSDISFRLTQLRILRGRSN